MEYSLMIDYYELTMANSYFSYGMKDTIACFDYFYRENPDNAGFSITCGLSDFISYIKNLKFSKDEINYLSSKKIFSKEFLNYLSNFKFSGDIYAIPEGSVVFPNEPIITIKAPIIECQIIETYLLSLLNHQSLIATKASRIVRAAYPSKVMEFGARRAHGVEAAILGSKAAYIAGVCGTSITYSDYKYKIPALGTMAHSYICAFPSEYDAFLAYSKTYPNDIVLLVDTYNTIKSGIPNAIRLYNEYLKKNNLKLKGIRIDSGDISYLSKKARKMLDDAGLIDCKIIISNSLDEYIIKELKEQGAKVDLYGVGERLITSKSSPVFGGVYKLSAIYKDGIQVPKIKISDTIVKTTIPGFKEVYRFYDEKDKAFADLITLQGEIIDESKPYLLFDPLEVRKEKLVKNYKLRKLTEQIFKNGKLVYKEKSITAIREYNITEVESLWDEVKRFTNPHNYYVDLSKKLYDLKNKMVCDENKE